MEEREVRHFHLFCGLGGGAVGFNRGRAELNGLRAKFRCIGGIDVSPAAIRDFQKAVGVRGTCLDMFDREQYIAFHGHEPPEEWQEATPDDVRTAAGNERPHIVFLSAPCKGFSGLLSQTRSLTGKYQALNRLTLRGVWLMLEAWADDPPELVIFENVPRIATRGRKLLDQIGNLLRSYGYAVAETFHDCGEIGNLAQSRKRFLLVARHAVKAQPFLYQPTKHSLRAVGEILDKLPLPGDLRGGPMHASPNLQWKTWVRLAFVEAGSDWRSLNKLRVVDGKLADYLLMPESKWEGAGCLGVNRWDSPSGTITSDARPMKGPFSVADPRMESRRSGALGVRAWDSPTGAVAGESLPPNGAFAVADPRHPDNDFGALNVEHWHEAAATVTGQRAGNNLFVSDPRIDGVRHNNVFRIVKWEQPSVSVTGGGHPNSGGVSVADPRWPNSQGEHTGKYHVVPYDEPAKTITGNDRIGSGALCVADPRPGWDRRGNNLVVEKWDEPSRTVIGGGKGVQGGWLSVADPRPAVQRSKGDDYLTNGNYGVIPWDQPTGAVSAAANHDNGRWNVADPRLPEASENLIAIIRALDGTWHRPFTTLELAALQSLIEPENIFDLDGNSDSAKRERIGNAVPPHAAQAIADVMGQTLLLAWSGETFMLSALPIWVLPVAVALSVKTPEIPG